MTSDPVSLRLTHRASFISAGVAVFALYLAAGLLRVALAYSSPYFSLSEPEGYYPAEAAMQYRWAERLARGEILPTVELRAQYPEGLRFDRDITLFMERTASWLYRLFFARLSQFFEYSVWFVAFASVLPVIAAYLWARSLGARSFPAFCGAAVLAVHPLSVERVVRNFGHENFALALLMTAVFLVCSSLNDRKLGSPTQAGSSRPYLAIILAAGAQWLAFLTWHMVRPIFALTTGAFVLSFLIGAYSLRHARLVALWLALVMPASLVLPVLKVRSYWFDPVVVLALSFVLAVYALKSTRFARLAVVGGCLLSCAWAMARAKGYDDSHVLALIVEKLRHALVKPRDPMLLSSEARLMWIEAFHSPRLDQVLLHVAPLMLVLVSLGIPALMRLRVLFRRSVAFRVFTVFLVCWFGCFVLIHRLHVLAFFGLAILYAIVTDFSLKRTRRPWIVRLVAAGFPLFLLWQTATSPTGNAFQRLVYSFTPRPAPAYTPWFSDLRELFHWIRMHTSREDVIGAWFGLSSQIYAWCDRPVVVQSKFENPTIRPKCMELANALYGAPAELEAFCRKYRVRYFVYEATMLLESGTDSLRYVAGQRSVATTSTVARMHLSPYELEEFELVYQNNSFRVFRFLGGEKFTNPAIPWEPMYERSYYRGLDAPYYDDSQTSAIVSRVTWLRQQVEFARALAVEGKLEEAFKLTMRLVAAEPRFWRAALVASKSALRLGHTLEACAAARQVLQGYPACLDAIRLISRYCPDNP
jgi:hypothetical protein